MSGTLAISVAPAPEATDDLAAVYTLCAGDLHAYAATLLRDPHAAEDVVALAFERALRRQASFDAVRGSRRAWLFGIVRNAALDELQRRRRAATLAAEPIDAGGPAAGDLAEDAASRTAVRAALLGLGARDREIIALKFHGGLTNTELARVLGTSESNAGTRLHRAVRRLREAVDAPL